MSIYDRSIRAREGSSPERISQLTSASAAERLRFSNYVTGINRTTPMASYADQQATYGRQLRQSAMRGAVANRGARPNNSAETMASALDGLTGGRKVTDAGWQRARYGEAVRLRNS